MKATKLFAKSINIGCYLPHNNEIDTNYLINLIWQEDKACYLPIIHNYQTRKLSFIRYFPNSELKENSFGIKEPIYKSNLIISPKNLDLVIMPLIAFDYRGNRLGHGFGFYDIFFSFLLKTRITHPKICGFAYSMQEVKNIVSDKWDVEMDYIATELNIIKCQKKIKGEK